MPGRPLPSDPHLLGLILVGAESRLAALRPFVDRAFSEWGTVDVAAFGRALSVWEREANPIGSRRSWRLIERLIHLPWRDEGGGDDERRRESYLANAVNDQTRDHWCPPEIRREMVELYAMFRGWEDLLDRVSIALEPSFGLAEETEPGARGRRMKARNRLCYELRAAGWDDKDVAKAVKGRNDVAPLGRSPHAVGDACAAHARDEGLAPDSAKKKRRRPSPT